MTDAEKRRCPHGRPSEKDCRECGYGEREYFIDDYGKAYPSMLELRKSTQHGPIIHAIEKSACDARIATLERELAEANEHLAEACAGRDQWRKAQLEITRLEGENAKLKAMLESAGEFGKSRIIAGRTREEQIAALQCDLREAKENNEKHITNLKRELTIAWTQRDKLAEELLEAKRVNELQRRIELEHRESLTAAHAKIEVMREALDDAMDGHDVREWNDRLGNLKLLHENTKARLECFRKALDHARRTVKNLAATSYYTKFIKDNAALAQVEKLEGESGEATR